MGCSLRSLQLVVLGSWLPVVACDTRPLAAATTPAERPPDRPAPEPTGTTAQVETPVPPRSLPATGILVSAIAVEPAARLALAAASETVVDPGAAFELVLAARVADARLVLLDAQDAQLPSRGASEVGRTTKLTLAPASPLVPGSRYVLRLEGAVGRALHDASGRAFDPLSFALLAAGTPPAPEPKRRSRRRRR